MIEKFFIYNYLDHEKYFLTSKVYFFLDIQSDNLTLL